MVENTIPDLVLLDTKTGKKYHIPMEGYQMVSGPYDIEFEAEIVIGDLLDITDLEEIKE
jgi:hypothetical protein